jgi:hypothetical protein
VSGKSKQIRRKILKRLQEQDEPINQKQFEKILQAVMPVEAGELAKVFETIQSRPAPLLNKETPILSSAEARLLDIPEEDDSGQMSLFHFYSDFSASPNVFIRSALFPPHENTKKREAFTEWQPIVAFEKEAVIEIKGERFCQYENDLVMVIIRLYSEKGIPFDKPLTTSTLAILKKLGLRTYSQTHYKMVATAIDRLTTSSIKLSYYWIEYMGSIFHDAYIDKKTNRWVIQLNSKLVSLFTEGQYTFVPLDTHFNLKKSLSKWLHLFLTSHKAPREHFAISIKKLHILSGSKVKAISNFRTQVKSSLIELEKAGIVRKGWKIEKDVLRVKIKKRGKRGARISNKKTPQLEEWIDVTPSSNKSEETDLAEVFRQLKEFENGSTA